MKRIPVFLVILLLVLSGCSNTSPLSVTPTINVPPTETATLVLSTSTPPKPSSTSTPIPSTICSPLQGFDFQQLTGIVKNPFQPPPPGKDYDHQGVDFSFWTYKDLATMEGLPVQSVLDGRVASVINNRYPYGNMVIIESPLTALSTAWLASYSLPTREPIQTPDPALACPAGRDEFNSTSTDLSLYLLYAHLDQSVNLKIGDAVTCGEVIGGVGTTGKSVNYHLHLEMRIGPSGAIFPSMAHYVNDATYQEEHNFCMWRVSGVFQMLDPMTLFPAKP